mmetsp:Transcript_7420/g.22288  ORF Transcript_7420/g.22288 Transcript_7420/m.22288 type:complete len:216 (-) Transcript_7420:322-969(-)
MSSDPDVVRINATTKPNNGIRTMRAITMPTAVRAGRSRASGRRERAAPSRTRLMGTAASPNFEAEMNSHPKGAVSGGKTSVLPKRPTMPPTVIPRTEGMKICRNNLRIRRGKANSELRMRPRTLRSLDAELSEDANGSSPIPLIEVSNGLPIGRQVEAKIPLSSTPWPELNVSIERTSRSELGTAFCSRDEYLAEATESSVSWLASRVYRSDRKA